MLPGRICPNRFGLGGRFVESPKVSYRPTCKTKGNLHFVNYDSSYYVVYNICDTSYTLSIIFNYIIDMSQNC